MSGRLEREPREVGQAYVICSLCVSHTHTHRAEKMLVWGWLSYLDYDASYSSPQPTESLAFRSHCFYHHVCAESALEIIYGFKNTNIVHCFGVILSNWSNQKLSTESEDRVWISALSVCALDCWLGDWFGTSWEWRVNWMDPPVWMNSLSCFAVFISCHKCAAQISGQVLKARCAIQRTP